MHARLPADYDEAQDYGVEFRSDADGDWDVIRLCTLPRVWHAEPARADDRDTGVGEAVRVARGDEGNRA